MRLETKDGLYKFLFVFGPYHPPTTELKTSLCRIGWMVLLWLPWLLMSGVAVIFLWILAVMTFGSIWLWQTFACARKGPNPFPYASQASSVVWSRPRGLLDPDAPSVAGYAESFNEWTWLPSVFDAKVRPWFTVLALTVIYVAGKNLVEFAIFAPMTFLGFVILASTVLFATYHKLMGTKTGLILTEMSKGIKGKFCPIIEIAPYTADKAP